MPGHNTWLTARCGSMSFKRCWTVEGIWERQRGHAAAVSHISTERDHVFSFKFGLHSLNEKSMPKIRQSKIVDDSFQAGDYCKKTS